MSDRQAHVLRAPDRKRPYPVRYMTVDTEFCGDQDGYQRLTLGQAAWRGGSMEFADPADFWDLVESRMVAGRTLTVLALNWGCDAQVLETDMELELRAFEQTSAPLLGTPWIIKCRKRLTDDGKYAYLHLLDISNWYRGRSVAELGEMLGYPKGEPPGGVLHERYRPDHGCVPGTPQWRLLSEYCLRDAEIVLKAMDELIGFAREHDIPWGDTLPAMAFMRIRERNHEKIFIHDNAQVTALERRSYHGEYAEALKPGTHMGGDYVKADICSMWPAVERENLYPVKLIGYRSARSIGRVNGLPPDRASRITELWKTVVQGYGVTAQVTLRVPDDPDAQVYPWTGADGLLEFPSGTFTTDLTTREVQRALDAGVLYDVHEFSVYQMDDIFSAHVDEFFPLKQRYREAGNDIYSDIAKLMLSSTASKFGQNPETWEIAPEEAIIEGYREEFTRTDTWERTIYWKFAGQTFRTTGEHQESRHSFCAIAAHVTADARLKMFDLVIAAGRKNVLYVKCDMLIVNDTGYRHLVDKDLTGRGELGKLDYKGQCTGVMINAVNDYVFGLEQVTAGVKKTARRVFVAGPEIEPSRGIYWQDRFTSMRGAMTRGDPNLLRIVPQMLNRELCEEAQDAEDAGRDPRGDALPGAPERARAPQPQQGRAQAPEEAMTTCSYCGSPSELSWSCTVEHINRTKNQKPPKPIPQYHIPSILLQPEVPKPVSRETPVPDPVPQLDLFGDPILSEPKKRRKRKLAESDRTLLPHCDLTSP